MGLLTPRSCRRRSCLLKLLCGLALVFCALLCLEAISGLIYRHQNGKSIRLFVSEDGTETLFGHAEQHQQHHHQQQQQPEKATQAGPDPHTAQTMRERVSRAEAFCQGRKSAVPDKRGIFQRCLLTSHPHRFQFCPIAKIGSTFWTRFFQVLQQSGGSGTVRSPYSVPLEGVEHKRCKAKNASLAMEPSGMLKATLVRDPFSRVFSAYVDKLLSPNPTFWEKWGKKAMKRDNATSNFVRCGQGVTFPQFLREATARLRTTDNHIMPMAGVCDPCKENFDVIATMETFAADLDFILAKINVTFRHDVQLSRETKLDAIYDSIQGPFGWMKKIKECITTPEMGRRIWRKLQIRGLISSGLDYPLGDRDLTNMTIAEFNNMAVEAHDKSTDKHGLSLQKKQAFVEAFRSVPLKDIQKYVDVFQSDFEVFGYDKTPSAVFNRDTLFVDTGALAFNKPWRLA